MKRIYIRDDVCIGCRLCEVHCVVSHSKSKDMIRAFRREAPRPAPRLTVEEEEYLSFALQCRHCDDAPCIAACISGAMHRDPSTQAVVCDEERCVGCWMCVMVCGFGVIQPSIGQRKIASKCDLCLGAEAPACVVNCPNEALTYEER